MSSASQADDGREVVVTGMGTFTAVGRNVEEFFASLRNGRTGVSNLEGIPIARGKRLATQIKDPPLGQARRATAFARAAVVEALEASGLVPASHRIGLFLATVAGDCYDLERHYADFVNAERGSNELRDAILAFPMHFISDRLAHELGLTGPRHVNTNACASGNIAIGQALEAIRAGTVDAAIACGTEQLRPTMYWGAERAGILGQSLRAFDRNRTGTLLGDGAAALVLETRAHAEARGARILAVCAGYGLSCSDAPDDILPPMDGAGVARAIVAALADAGDDASAVDLINAHATGTINIEIAECAGLRQVFGARTPDIPITATKSYSGHLSAASAVLEVVATILAIERGFVHPTIGLDEVDPALGVAPVRGVGLSRSPRCALSISMGAGGVNSAVVLRPPDRSALRPATSRSPDEEWCLTAAVPVSARGIGLEAFMTGLAEPRALLPLHPGLVSSGTITLARLGSAFPRVAELDRYNHCALLGLTAGVLAVREAGLATDLIASTRFGIIVGTSLGGTSTWSRVLCDAYSASPWHITPLMALSHGAHLCTTLLARELGVLGPTITLTDGVTGGFAALAQAVELLRSGRCEAVLVCGVDALDPSVARAYHVLSRMGSRGGVSQAITVGEGAAAFIVESRRSAMRRGRAPVSRLVGVTEAHASGGAGRYDPAPLVSALTSAARKMSGPLVLFSSANGFAARDRVDAIATERFRRGPHGTRVVAVASLRSAIGEAGAATPMLALAAALAAAQQGRLPGVLRSDTDTGAGMIPPEASLLVGAVAPGGAAACVAIAASSRGNAP